MTEGPGWAFRLGELALVVSGRPAAEVAPELQGEIVEVIALPRLVDYGQGHKKLAYSISHDKHGQYYATPETLRKLPPPGTRPCDATYDGNEKTSWDAGLFTPTRKSCLLSS